MRARKYLYCIRKAAQAYRAAKVTSDRENDIAKDMNDYNNECGRLWLEYAWVRVDEDFARGGR